MIYDISFVLITRPIHTPYIHSYLSDKHSILNTLEASDVFLIFWTHGKKQGLTE